MRLPDSSYDELGDDLIFDPVLERKRIADGTEEYLEEMRRDFAKYASGKNSVPEKISKISLALREWMLSFDRTNFYDRLAGEFGLQGADRVGIARIAWDIVLQSEWSPRAELFQKHISQASVVPEISKRFAVDFIPKARELSLIADARQNASLSSISRSVLTEQKAVDRVEISLMQALGKFEKLGGQQVTNSKIVVKGQNDPVRPTIFNWLRAYRDELGVGAHDAVARGQFLFHSLNGKGLSADERDQVGLLLKSLDENMPLTIDAGRQEVIFNQQTTINRQHGAFQTAVAPLQKRNDRSQIQNSDLRQPTDPKAERPLFANQDGNISRAVFELPVVNQQTTNSRQQGANNSQQITGSREQNTIQTAVAKIESRTADAPPAGGATDIRAQMTRPSAFEQAKAIQEANRESRLSISNIASETVELGRMTAPREEIRSVAPPRPSIAPTVQSVAPAPRAISFEPAKIDNFSFSNNGLRQPADQAGERPLPTRTEDFRPNFAPRDDANVSALSFSTNHVMPAEKEAARTTVAPPAGGVSAVREQNTVISDSNSGLRQPADPTAQRPMFENKQQAGARTTVTPPVVRQPSEPAVREENAKPLPTLPLERGGGVNGGATALPVSMPVQKTAAPANRYRITPTGHRDEVASDDTPSPHVVDLRG